MRRHGALLTLVLAVAGCSLLPAWGDREATLTIRAADPAARVAFRAAVVQGDGGDPGRWTKTVQRTPFQRRMSPQYF